MSGPPDDEWVVRWPTLGLLIYEWVYAHCIVPDGFDKGRPFEMYRWQTWCTCNHYRVKPDATAGQKAAAFHYRRSQVVGPQKSGKGPWSATIIATEAVGPALFDGWAGTDDGYVCADHGCRCGFEYAYEPGEPMGKPWATPLIQLLATSEDQTDNVYMPLQSMIRNGPLSDMMRVGEQFIRLPNDGRIDVVTSNATSRLGNPITFALQDETGLYTPQNKMTKVAETQRRGLAGMGGRAIETTNAPDPSEDSTANRTKRSKRPDLFVFHRKPAPDLSFKAKRDRAKILRYVYEGCDHVDLADIEAEAAELIEHDPPQAERFYGNIEVAGGGRAVDPFEWANRAVPKGPDGSWTDGKPPAGTEIGLGFDGSISDDATMLRGCTRDGWSFIVGKWIRPQGPKGRGWRVPRLQVDQAVRDAFATWQVGRMLCDPPKWHTEIEGWAEEFGDETVLFFDTNSDRRMGPAVDRWTTGIATGAHTHDDDPDTTSHVLAAHRRKARANAPDDDNRTLYTLVKGDDGSKIDGAVADVLAFEAAKTMPEIIDRDPVEPIIIVT